MVVAEEKNALVRPAVRFSGAEQCITIPAQQNKGNFRAQAQIMCKWYLVKVVPSQLQLLSPLRAWCVTLKFTTASSTNCIKISTRMLAQLPTVSLILRDRHGYPLHPSYSSSFPLNNYRDKNLHLSSLIKGGHETATMTYSWLWRQANTSAFQKSICLVAATEPPRQTASFPHSLHPQEIQPLSKDLS